jgi:ATP-binding cassette subfamily B protein
MKKPITDNQLLDFAEMLLNDNNMLSIRMKGYSMFPTLQVGDVGFVRKCSVSELAIGDIVVFRENKKLIAHRLIKIIDKNDTFFYITKGDKNTYTDKPFTEKEFLGKIEYIERGGKKITPEDNKMKVRTFLTLNFSGMDTRLNQFFANLHSFSKNASEKYHSIKRNFSIVTENSKKITLINSLITILQGVLPFVIIVCIKLLVDLLSAQTTHFEDNKFQFWVLLGITAFIFLFNGILSEVRGYFSEKLTQSVTKNIYKKLHDKHIDLDLSHYENAKEQNAMHRAIQEASYRPVKITNDFLTLIRSIAAGLILISIFISIKWYLVLVMVIATIPGVLHKVRFARRVYQLKISQSATEREMYYYNRVLTAFPFAKEMRLFDFSNFFRRKFSNVQERIFNEKLNLQKSQLTYGILSQIFAVSLIFLSLALITYLKFTGAISTGTVVLFFFAFQRGYSVLNDLFSSITQFVEDNTFMNDLMEVLQLKTTTKITDKKPFNLTKSIEIQNVSFSYQTSEREALKSVNIQIPAGKTVAFAGANGSGKTTMIKLLCGFYQPSKGKILFDDTDATEIGMHNICLNTSAVFQDFALYNITAMLNIGIGNIKNNLDSEKAKEAARNAGIYETLEKLPNGFDNMLGTLFEGSEELSIGQWQKLALARAFYRDAPLILMDEPSSALDAISEMQIIESLKKLAENKTAIIISHRLTTVKWADYIYFFDQGEITEQGTHDELMALKGKYYQMFQTSGSKYFVE